MTEEQKADLYGRLLNEHTRNHNKINEIKGQDIDLNSSQREQIKQLELSQIQIMEKIRSLLSR